MGLPVALEGALKLEEISYIPTDTYAAGEMKHGPIALLEEGSPVLVVATDSRVYDELIRRAGSESAGSASHCRGVRGEPDPGRVADEILYVPRTDEMLAPLLSIVPLQLFAYYVAERQGREGRSSRATWRRPSRSSSGERPGEVRPGAGPASSRPRRALIGLDLVDVERFRRALDRRPALEPRLFSPAESPAAGPLKADPALRRAVRSQGGGW